MIWDVPKAQQRFNLAHAPLGVSQLKLQRFLEEQLEAKGEIRCYGTTTNPSQQLKNKLGQAGTIPGGILTLSVETRAVHDRAVKTLVEDWAANEGWAKTVACVAIVHPTDLGWKIGTIVEWERSRFPDAVKAHLFPDVVVVAAKGSPALLPSSIPESKYGARIYALGDKVLVKQMVLRGAPAEYVIDGQRERHVDKDDDKAIATAVRAAIAGKLK